MARGRMLSKDISLDEKVDALSTDTARLLFTWLIPHLDCEGRMYGDPQIFKSIVAPRRNYSIRKVGKYLTEMENLGLIFRYAVNGNCYLSAPHFEKHQTGLRKDKESQSKIPSPNPNQRRSNDGLTQLQVKVKDKDKERKKYIKKEGTLPDEVKELVSEFLKLPGWGNGQNDVEWLSEFLADFPGFSILHFKACRDHHLAKSIKHTRGAWKSRLRNWMTNETKWRVGAKGKSRGLPTEYTPQREDYD